MIEPMLPETIELDPADLEVEGSDGVGRKSRIPWVRVFSLSRAPSATSGWYLVYLFAADGSSVFLSLNQGTTRPERGQFTNRPADFLADRVEWARQLLGDALNDVSGQDEIRLQDSGNLGSGYERGNVWAIEYPFEDIPSETDLQRDLAAFVGLLSVIYSNDTLTDAKPPVHGQRPSVKDSRAFVAWMRDWYGPDLVESRSTAEQEARDLLDEAAGRMTKEQALQLGRFFNRGVWQGIMKHNRFSPAFVGATMEKVIDQLELFNEWTQRLWTASYDDALKGVDQILKDKEVFPGAGRSYPTMLMYLRDPSKFCIWLQSTHTGLAAMTGFPYAKTRQGGSERYLKYCETALAFAKEHDLAPQEIDAILSEAARTPKTKPLKATAAGTSKPITVPLPAARPSLLEVAQRTYIAVDQLEEWLRLVQGRKKQALFYGPPGTGKTFVASQLAGLIAENNAAIETVQFHPSFSYEDFVEGLRPILSKPGSVGFEIKDGIFKTFCDKARRADGMHVLIVDEINRADLGSVLGELMLLLEYRDRQVELPYSRESFSIPENLVLLATMNTADRSLALVDYALRRRFHALEMQPSRDVLAAYLQGKGEDAEVALEFYDLVQARISSRDFAPGHSYWMLENPSTADLYLMWKYELHPYLAEYWFEHRSQLDDLDREVGKLLAEEA
jgi:hypothetical protein